MLQDAIYNERESFTFVPKIQLSSVSKKIQLSAIFGALNDYLTMLIIKHYEKKMQQEFKTLKSCNNSELSKDNIKAMQEYTIKSERLDQLCTNYIEDAAENLFTDRVVHVAFCQQDIDYRFHLYEMLLKKANSRNKKSTVIVETFA